MRISAAAISLFVYSMLMLSIAFDINEFFPDERDALMQLRDLVNSTSNLHGNWTGPPCSKSNQSRWAGIACSDWHVSHLVLEGIQLTGSLPPMFLLNLTFLTKLSFRKKLADGFSSGSHQTEQPGICISVTKSLLGLHPFRLH